MCTKKEINLFFMLILPEESHFYMRQFVKMKNINKILLLFHYLKVKSQKMEKKKVHIKLDQSVNKLVF